MPAMTLEEKGIKAIYELGYLLVPSLNDEEVAAHIADIKASLARAGAELIAEEAPVLRGLAYAMTKTSANKKSSFDQGFFGWVKFELERESTPLLEGSIAERDDVIRFLLIETVRENTMRRRERPIERRAVLGEKLSEEEIERSIEALVKE